MRIFLRSTDSTGPGGRPSVAAAASSPLTSREVLLPPQPPHQPGPRRSKEVLGSLGGPERFQEVLERPLEASKPSNIGIQSQKNHNDILAYK